MPAVLFGVATDGSYFGQLLIWAAAACVQAASLRLVMLIGEINLSTAGFCAIGAYGAGYLGSTFGVPMLAFCVSEVVRLLLTRAEFLGGNSGLVGIVPDLPAYAAIAALLAVLTIVALYIAETSTLGLLFRAIRNHEPLVQAVGINVRRVKIACLAIASAAVGLSGGLQAYANSVIAPGDFSFLLSVYALAYVKFGGDGSVIGACLGAVLLTVISQYMLGLGADQTILFGGALLVGLIVMPRGVYGTALALLQRLRRGGRPAGIAIPVAGDET
ncbi:MAG: branched-chain amino acid ABC transporter permease [Alphaproteobacteria bacterium]|nr:branched-chain amino acid ABC transporter permease [Alphaproteobacteria bacterium]